MKPSFWLTALLASGLCVAATQAHATLFRYPSNCHSGCMVVTSYFDLGGVKDWNCGNNTYSGHKGTDFAPYGKFDAMDEGRDILAAAEGDVTISHDGEFDRCTTSDCGGGSGYGNYVRIKHADGKSTTYGHMKKGTVAVGVGDHVTCGQKIGQIGSSGNSSGPHLHFEVRVNDTTADDPFGGGNCGGPESYWVVQGDYNGLPGQDCESTVPNNDDAQVVGQTPALDSHVAPGAVVQQRWTVKNTGDTTWTKGNKYLWTWDEGEKFGAPEQTNLDDGESLGPGASREFVVQLQLPTTPGTYSGFWTMDRYGTHRFGKRGEARFVVDSTVQPDAGKSDASTSDAKVSDAKSDRATDSAGTDAKSAKEAGSSDLASWNANDDGGCGCKLAGQAPRSWSGALLGLGLAIWLLKRRRSPLLPPSPSHS